MSTLEENKRFWLIVFPHGIDANEALLAELLPIYETLYLVAAVVLGAAYWRTIKNLRHWGAESG